MAVDSGDEKSVGPLTESRISPISSSMVTDRRVKDVKVKTLAVYLLVGVKGPVFCVVDYIAGICGGLFDRVVSSNETPCRIISGSNTE